MNQKFHARILLEDLSEDIQRSPFGAVMVDHSSACDRTEYMSVEVQYMLDGKRHHAFVLLQHVVKADAASLYDKLVIHPCIVIYTLSA